MSVLVIDCDDFKDINDRAGHGFGDALLVEVARILESALPENALVGRLGGDEFVVVLPETDPTGAYVLAEKIRQGVESLDVQIPRSDIRPSLSIGVVAYPGDGRTADELIIAADAAMYRSKRGGKNRVTGVQAPAPVVAGGPGGGRGVASRP
jgi:diguanylate cyclase (GGDEF)-like protein